VKSTTYVDDTGGFQGRRSAQRRKKQRRRRKGLKIVGFSIAGVVAVAAAGATYIYVHLDSNIKSAALYTGTDKAAAVGVEKPDAFGRTPLNVLLIGSDTRDTKQDCDLGGDCDDGGTGANADVEMLVHLSADRSNITVMSIPRDTVTQLPQCAGDATEQITSSLQSGPSCTAEAVHKLTGITIDDFLMVDFGGVVNLSDALGGVNVCVSSNVYDIYSGLKLSQGDHVVQGTSALEFLRTRHAFGDGSDNVGRTTATHIFFTNMINKLKTGGTLDNPLAMYKIADTATKALTASPGLDSLSKLLDLADDMNKVPTDRITFTTMQNEQYTGGDSQFASDVQEAPGAQGLFGTIINDQSLTSPSGVVTTAGASASASASASPSAAPVPLSSIAVSVENGSGIDGRASAVTSALVGDGLSSRTSASTAPSLASTSSLSYGAGDAAEANAVAKLLGLPAKDVSQGSGSGLTLVIGSDWSTGTSYPNSKPSAAPVDTASVLAGAIPQTADKNNECVQVSTDYTETLYSDGGPGETPQQEYALYPKVPNSAP
jgi:LCP family protein required for cell wall assembly